MSRIHILFVAALAMLALALAGAAQASTQLTGTLAGKVGPGFTITLTQNGKSVKNTTLKAGTYKVNVNDLGTIHNFHLFGPGVNKKTSVAGTGKVTWMVKLTKGSYTYRCDIHFASGMIGHFKVK
jgi:plastocyanin